MADLPSKWIRSGSFIRNFVRLVLKKEGSGLFLRPTTMRQIAPLTQLFKPNRGVS